jgi:hypothetical protein
MRRGGDLGHFTQQLRIGRRLVEVVVADQAAERLAAELTVFRLVDLLEQRALIPGRALVALQRFPEILLADVHEADLEHLVGLGVVDQVVQPAPGALELLEVRVMQDQVDLLGQLLVQLRNDRFDGLDDVAADQFGLGERLLRQGPDRLLDGFLRFIGFRLEFFSQKRIEFRDFNRGRFGSWVQLGFRISHGCSPLEGSHDYDLDSSSGGFFVVARVCSSAGSCNSLLTRSSAPDLPSM